MFEIKSEKELIKKNINPAFLKSMPLVIEKLDGAESYYIITEAPKPNNELLCNLLPSIISYNDLLNLLPQATINYLSSCTNIIYKFFDIYNQQEIKEFTLEGLAFQNKTQKEQEQEQEEKSSEFAVLYKTQEKLEDKDGNNIRKGSKYSQEEIESFGLDFNTLLKEEKLIEIKVVK